MTERKKVTEDGDRPKPRNKSGGGGFQNLGLSDEIYRGVVKMGFRVRLDEHIKVLEVCMKFNLGLSLSLSLSFRSYRCQRQCKENHYLLFYPVRTLLLWLAQDQVKQLPFAYHFWKGI